VKTLLKNVLASTNFFEVMHIHTASIDTLCGKRWDAKTILQKLIKNDKFQVHMH
jgi:hypothetical protein